MKNLQKLLESNLQILQDSTIDLALKRASMFSQTLLEWNATHNLSGAKNKSQVEANIIDSLLPLCVISPFKTCLDIGSGAGFPALIMALARPNVAFCLCEPRAKRVAFLSFVIQKLGLENVQIKKTRIENQKSIKSNMQDFQARFELITSRATMETQRLIQATKDFKSNNGFWLFFKGSKSSDFGDLSCNLSCNFTIDFLLNVKKIYAKDLDFSRTNGYNSERIYLYIS